MASNSHLRDLVQIAIDKSIRHELDAMTNLLHDDKIKWMNLDVQSKIYRIGSQKLVLNESAALNFPFFDETPFLVANSMGRAALLVERELSLLLPNAHLLY